MGDEGFILIAVLIGAYILIMPLVAFITAKGASGKIKNLQAEVERLKIQAGGQGKPAPEGKSTKATPQAKVAAKAIPEPKKSKEPWAPPEEKAAAKASKEPTPPREPKGPTFFDRMAANFKTNWIIWLAGVSLALGGLFIVQYGLERGYLGPVARVLCALGFGAALLAVAEYLRRLPNMGMEGWFTVPVALAAGGVSSLYGGVVSAHVLYDLTSPLVGFASMVLVSFLAVGAGLIYGPVLAVIGILGAFISPAIVSTGEGHTIMYLYFLSVLVTALAVERMRRWIWLSTLAVIFTLIAGLGLNDAIPDQPYLALYIIAVIGAVTTIPAFGIWPKWHQTEMINEKTLGNISTHYPTILTIATAAAGTVLLSITATDSLILWQTALLAFLGLTAWAVFWCQRAQNLDQLAIIFAGGLIFIATAGNPLMHYQYRDTLDLAPHLTMLHTILALLAVLFMLASFWRTPRSIRPLFWVASGAIAPVLIYFLSFANWHGIAPINDRAWTFAAILLATFLMASALLMLRSGIRQRRTGSDLYFAGMLIATSFAAYMTIEIDYLAHIAALLSLAALALVIRFKYRWTGYLITVFVAASTSLVVFDLFPVYSLQQPVLWVIAIFGVVAGLLVAGYMMAKRAKLPNRMILFETAILLTVALLICALIARVASGGRWELEYMSIGLYATVWAMMAGVQFKRMAIDARLTKLRKYLGYGYSTLALGALALAIILSPLFDGRINGIFPIDTVMVAFALPAIAAYGLYHFKLLPDFITAKIAYGFTGAMAGFIAIMQVRRFWHGSNIRLYKGTEVGELYTYTVVLLVATVITVMLAITRKNPVLRKIGLGLAALTAAKVFLWDTAGMQGLTRATVFIILGLTLAGVGWLLQTSQTGDIGKKPPE
jgi:uncharacterized membrane protein